VTERKVALVTGGTRGIGLGIARALAGEGFDLALGGVRPDSDVNTAMDEVASEGSKVIYARGDVSDADARTAILSAVRDQFGRLDLLVNNAGIAPQVRQDVLEADEASLDRLLAVNLKGPWFLTRDAARWMIEERVADPGRPLGIVNIGSISADVASASRGEYCLSKAALGMATMLWASRLAEHGISVWEIRPGLIATDMTAKVTERYDRFIAEGGLLESRWGTPEDIGRAVAMLSRGDLPYATGQVLTMDGGLTLRRL